MRNLLTVWLPASSQVETRTGRITYREWLTLELVRLSTSRKKYEIVTNASDKYIALAEKP